MKRKVQQSYYTKEPIVKQWYVVDASKHVLGRLAAEVAKVLRGKNKPEYMPSVDNGDFVVVINSDKVKVTGNKEVDKVYYRHSGYPGGLKSISLADQRKKDSRKLIYSAVKGMLPDTRLGRKALTKLKIYENDQHPHEAQGPKTMTVNGRTL